MLIPAVLLLVAAPDALPPPLAVAAREPEAQERARTDAQSERLAAERRRPTFSAGLLLELPTDLGAARLGVTRADLGIQAPLPPLGGWRIRAELASEWSWYDFDDFGSVAGGLGAPLSHGHSSLLGFTALRTFADAWTLVARPVVVSSADPDADFGDTLLFGGFVTIGRRLGDDVTLSVGAYAAEQFEEDAVVFPIAGIEWQIDDATRLTSPGPGLRLTRELGEGWQGFAQGIYRPRDYRLSEGSSVPGGALSDDAFPVTVGALWTPRPGLVLGVQAGTLLGRDVEVRDDEGDVVFEEDADTSVFAGVSLRIGI